MQCGVCGQPVPKGADRCPLCTVPLKRRCYPCGCWNPADVEICQKCKRTISDLPVDQDARPMAPEVTGVSRAGSLLVCLAVLFLAGAGAVLAFVKNSVYLAIALDLSLSCSSPWRSWRGVRRRLAFGWNGLRRSSGSA